MTIQNTAQADSSCRSEDSFKRGQVILKTVLGIRNVRIASIATHVRELLSSDVWRDYVLPNGVRYSWHECEFDYFLMATDLDPVLIDQAIRASGDRALALQFAAACTGSIGNRRRLNEVLKEHPELKGRIRDVSLGGQLRRVVTTSESREKFLAGASPSNAGHAREWFSVGWKAGSSLQAKAAHLARRIVERDVDLAIAVVEALKQYSPDSMARADASVETARLTQADVRIGPEKSEKG